MSDNFNISFLLQILNNGEGTPTPLVETANFLHLQKSMPVFDVRSPEEFAQGHIPGAISMPLFSNEERAFVGTLYKQYGRDAAFEHGLQFVLPKIKHFLDTCATVCHKYNSKQLAIYCWRGGERSAAVAKLLEKTDFLPHRLLGGYKAFRNFTLAMFAQPYHLLVLSGKTGSGKTEILHELAKNGSQVIDLEHLAKHRGSAFGAFAHSPQPSCEHFENRLACKLFHYTAQKTIWVEDESQKLGKVRLPKAFFERMRTAPAVLLQTEQPLRLKRVLEEYSELSEADIRKGLERIQERLGGLIYKQARVFLQSKNLPALAELLLEYYDRGYAHNAQKRAYLHTEQFGNTTITAQKLSTFGKKFS